MSNLFKGCLGCLGLLVVLALLVGGCTAFFDVDEGVEVSNNSVTETGVNEADTETSADQDSETVHKEVQETNEPDSWLSKIQDVAVSSKSETEKFDEISLYAQDYTPNTSELKEFEKYIIDEFTSGAYLSGPSNDAYMLENIFKSEVIDVYYRNSPQVPIGDFAFDFWQNTKYVYRGVDTVDSDPVKANEEQMNKALAKMN
ncbi:hypothetical protein [Bacillus sp. 37MA]|uniref:hypothetical protein n=1 Tax=Bacillus sp. 37MA TaxID=1132442 RepID=UPI00037E7C95|nr:hypothetical protein [Bacillus sp. 37MA]